jgi:NAD(P)-dependent dehydrogenase (short-subunit alcohol dehydrogenase family)
MKTYDRTSSWPDGHKGDENGLHRVRSLDNHRTMAIELNGLVCLIPGAEEGIGHGVVKGFLQRGAKVAAGLYDAAKSASRVAPALALPMDVTKADPVRAAVAKTVETFGRVDVLVYNAGIYIDAHK